MENQTPYDSEVQDNNTRLRDTLALLAERNVGLLLDKDGLSEDELSRIVQSAPEDHVVVDSVPDLVFSPTGRMIDRSRAATRSRLALVGALVGATASVSRDARLLDTLDFSALEKRIGHLGPYANSTYAAAPRRAAPVVEITVADKAAIDAAAAKRARKAKRGW